MRYIGQIVSVVEDYGFIGASTVSREDGQPQDLTNFDFFLHQQECAVPIEPGLTVSFLPTRDIKRGDAYFRAMGAVAHIETGALIPVGEAPIPGLTLADRFPELTPAQLGYLMRMKKVDTGTVEGVARNEPLADVRAQAVPTTEDEKRAMLEAYLESLFPTLATYEADFDIHADDDTALDAKVEEMAGTMEGLGLTDQVPVLRDEAERFKRVRGSLALLWEEGLVRPDAIVPIHHLPDLFMASPVWYFWTDGDAARQAAEEWGSGDPKPHASVMYFCDLFRNEQWRNVFQLFNRRVRTLKQYKGENIPAHIVRRMHRAVRLFDYVVIATPYVDVAGREWQDPNWLRSIDPYVLGFHKGVPFFFVLGRYSDTGTFPLLHELTADVITFLRQNREQLEGFNTVGSPFWYDGRSESACRPYLGAHLKDVVDQLLAAFEAGTLYSWLRGEDASDGIVPARS